MIKYKSKEKELIGARLSTLRDCIIQNHTTGELTVMKSRVIENFEYWLKKEKELYK